MYLLFVVLDFKIAWMVA